MSAITCLCPKYYILNWDHGAGTVYITLHDCCFLMANCLLILNVSLYDETMLF